MCDICAVSFNWSWLLLGIESKLSASDCNVAVDIRSTAGLLPSPSHSTLIVYFYSCYDKFINISLFLCYLNDNITVNIACKIACHNSLQHLTNWDCLLLMLHHLSQSVNGIIFCSNWIYCFIVIYSALFTTVEIFLTFTCILQKTRCSAIAERPRCRVRYSFRQK